MLFYFQCFCNKVKKEKRIRLKDPCTHGDPQYRSGGDKQKNHLNKGVGEDRETYEHLHEEKWYKGMGKQGYHI